MLLEYQGFDSAASLNGFDILGALYTIKESFMSYFFDFSKGPNAFCILNLILLVLTLVLYIKDVIKNKLSIGKFLMLCVLVVFLPIGASVLSFINSGIDYHNLMLMGYCVFYLFFIILYERGTDTKEKHTVVKNWIILLTAVVLILNQVVISNVSYHKAQMAYEKSYGVLVRIADRIEQT
jgi:lysylphosphatidylglycerol synthetase-like protein (DUF2156 family)